MRDIYRSPMFRLVYSASHNRATPYLMGIGTAILMHKLHTRQHRFTAVSRVASTPKQSISVFSVLKH